MPPPIELPATCGRRSPSSPKKRSNASANAPPSASTPGWQRGRAAEARRRRRRSRRGARPAGRSPGSTPASGSRCRGSARAARRAPRRCVVHGATGRAYLAELLGADRPGGAHVLDHEARPVVHHPAACPPGGTSCGSSPRPSRAGAPARGSRRARSAPRAGRRAPRPTGARCASGVDRVAHLRLDHHDDRAHAQVGVGPVEHEHVREPGHRDPEVRLGAARPGLLEVAPARSRSPASARRSRSERKPVP